MSWGKKIKKLLRVPRLLEWSKRYTLPGLSGVKVYYVLRFIIQEIQKDDITTRANSIAFNFFLALFPTIIFVFTLLPLLPFTAEYNMLIQQSLMEVLPRDAATYLNTVIDDILSIKREGLLSLGFLLAVVFASSGVHTLMTGFDKTYKISFNNRSFIKKRAIAIGLTFLLGIVLILSLVLIILSQPIINYVINELNLSAYSATILITAKWISVISLIYFLVSLIYKYGPSLKKRTKIFNTGSYLATFASIGSSLLFSYFVNNFGRYNELYGSIGALIVLMIWLQINAFILLIGFEINASIAVNKDLLFEDMDHASEF